ncbi:hypothetical protein [Priestia koreensis]|uniref:Uncharacterized protein n=1 Tax=Priestia koreensis TaxID=284581 RepID=A0A0M0L7C3_9BACI|nr:hypothetical protein [Priestia koreensis]KOO46955.1 hypothetical protein AMD01_08565 [Priestia koreensis]
MLIFLASLIGALLIIPVLYFVPKNITLIGKLIVVALSLLVVGVSAVAQQVMPLWQATLCFILLGGLLAYFLAKKNDLLLVANEDEQLEAATGFNLFKTETAIASQPSKQAHVDSDDYLIEDDTIDLQYAAEHQNVSPAKNKEEYDLQELDYIDVDPQFDETSTDNQNTQPTQETNISLVKKEEGEIESESWLDHVTDEVSVEDNLAHENIEDEIVPVITEAEDENTKVVEHILDTEDVNDHLLIELEDIPEFEDVQQENLLEDLLIEKSDLQGESPDLVVTDELPVIDDLENVIEEEEVQEAMDEHHDEPLAVMDLEDLLEEESAPDIVSLDEENVSELPVIEDLEDVLEERVVAEEEGEKPLTDELPVSQDLEDLLDDQFLQTDQESDVLPVTYYNKEEVLEEAIEDTHSVELVAMEDVVKEEKDLNLEDLLVNLDEEGLHNERSEEAELVGGTVPQMNEASEIDQLDDVFDETNIADLVDLLSEVPETEAKVATEIETISTGSDEEEEILMEETSVEDEKTTENNEIPIYNNEEIKENLKLKQRISYMFIQDLELARDVLDETSYEAQLQSTLYDGLPNNEYYVVAKMLLEHYKNTNQTTSFEQLFADLRVRYETYPVLVAELEFIEANN